MVVLGKHQIDAGPLEVSVKQQIRVGHDNRVRRRMGGAPIDMDVRIEVRPLAVNGQLDVEFVDKIQWATAKG